MLSISNKLAQRWGFLVIIALLVLSTLLAWRIQENFSERSFEIYRRYVQEQEILTGLRRAMWGASVALRDYYIDPDPDRRQIDAQMNEFTSTSRRLVADLKSLSGHAAATAELELRLNELWRRTGMAMREDWDRARRFDFLQDEIVPLRDEVGRLVQEIERANRTALADSEVEWRETRRGAATRLLLILGICLCCGVLVAIFSIRNSETLEREAAYRYEEVSEAKRQLEELSARLIEVQEEERTRLSRELHDEIVQNLAVLKMEIVQAQSMADLKDVREPLKRARHLAEEAVRTVRDISLLLRPSLLDDLGLGPAMQWQAEEFSRRTGIGCKLEDKGVSETLPEAIKTCVYRVVQEALRNCEKHSGATMVHVCIEETQGNLIVVIEDNGKGFTNSSRKPSNLGLLGMRERALTLGGVLQAFTRSEGGASVRVVLPVSDSSKTLYSGAHA